MIGPMATAGQMMNGQIASCLYHCWSRLEKLEDEHSEGVYAVVKPSIKVRFFEFFEFLKKN
jgi:conserved oligomeric Golgi complex subunit 5